MAEPILVADGVRKVYRSGGTDVLALKGLDLTVPHGQFLAVMGPPAPARRRCSTACPGWTRSTTGE